MNTNKLLNDMVIVLRKVGYAPVVKGSVIYVKANAVDVEKTGLELGETFSYTTDDYEWVMDGLEDYINN